MSSNPPVPPAAKPPVTAGEILMALLGEAGDVTAFAQAVITMVAAEKTATSYEQRVKLAEPVAELGAAIADKLKAAL